MTKEAMTKGEKILLAIVIIFVVLIGAVGYGFYSINVNPVVSIPTQIMLEPNAWDVYEAAGDMTNPSFIDRLSPSILNVSNIYLCINLNTGTINPLYPGEKTPRLEDLQSMMKLNAPALAKADEGLHLKYRDKPVRSFDDASAQYMVLGDLARIMQSDGELKCLQGDWDGGAERFLNVLQLASDISRGAGLDVALPVLNLLNSGLGEVWCTLDHVSSMEARRAARRLEEIAAHRVLYADVLQEEKWSTQASLLELFNTPRWRTKLIHDRYIDTRLVKTFRIYIASKRTIMKNYTRYMDACIAQARQPYSAKSANPLPPTDPVCRLFIPDYKDAPWQYVRAETKFNLLIVSFALRAYQEDHGSYPEKLVMLLPTYLKAIPVDPFTAGNPLTYKVTGKSYMLYSVGPDGKDDGGAPSADGRAPVLGPSGRYIATDLNETSTGDIVVGVNN